MTRGLINARAAKLAAEHLERISGWNQSFVNKCELLRDTWQLPDDTINQANG